MNPLITKLGVAAYLAGRLERSQRLEIEEARKNDSRVQRWFTELAAPETEFAQRSQTKLVVNTPEHKRHFALAFLGMTADIADDAEMTAPLSLDKTAALTANVLLPHPLVELVLPEPLALPSYDSRCEGQGAESQSKPVGQWGLSIPFENDELDVKIRAKEGQILAVVQAKKKELVGKTIKVALVGVRWIEIPIRIEQVMVKEVKSFGAIKDVQSVIGKTIKEVVVALPDS